MMTLPFGPAAPYGFDPFRQNSKETGYIDPSLLELPHPNDMTKNNDAGHGFPGQQAIIDQSSLQLDVAVHGQSFPSTQYLPRSGSEATKSPGRSSNQQSSAISEDTGSPFSQIVYTPSSTHDFDLFPANDGVEGVLQDEDDSSKSPLSDSFFSSTTDSSYCMVTYSDSGEALPAGRPALMDPRPQGSASGASAQQSRASSVAVSLTPNHTTASQWTASLFVSDGVMGNNTNALPSSAFDGSDAFTFGSGAFHSQNHQNIQYDWMQNTTSLPNNATNDMRNDPHNSFRAFGDSAQQSLDGSEYTAGSTFSHTAPPAQQLREQQHYFANQYQQSQMLFSQPRQMQNVSSATAHGAHPNFPVTSSLMVDHSTTTSSTSGIIPTGNMPIRPHQQPRNVLHQARPMGSSRAQPYPYQQARLQVPAHQNAHSRVANPFLINHTSTAPSRRQQIAPREVKRPVVPSNAPATAVQAGISKKGGRSRNTHLDDGARQQTSKMRGITACWRCALQRDRCDEGDPCRRCSIRSQKNQQDLLGCDRSKLPDWIDELLPLSMTGMHDRPSIEKFVTQQVKGWKTDNAIDIYLTSGYGPPLMWRCCEFEPRGQELLGQLQYLQDTSTGSERAQLKYAPPFALAKLDESDDAKFQDYLDKQLMHPDLLGTLGWTFYEEECAVDPNFFQAQVLELLCSLFNETSDKQLREALQDILRMLIVTYIMGHTLTIAEDTLPTVLASVQYAGMMQQHTSPRLANRQLKYYFSSLRKSTYVRVLHRQQQTFHDSKRKEAHWLVSFCAMLGFAMVLEENQRTIQIQADAKVTKREMTPERANAEALNHCQRTDEKFEKLVGFFQKKYNDRKWDNGSFGNRTPTYRTVAETKFLSSLYQLLYNSQDHLRSRESVPLGQQNQCQYTTRLVAKFLLPFLKLAN